MEVHHALNLEVYHGLILEVYHDLTAYHCLEALPDLGAYSRVNLEGQHCLETRTCPELEVYRHLGARHRP